MSNRDQNKVLLLSKICFLRGASLMKIIDFYCIGFILAAKSILLLTVY